MKLSAKAEYACIAMLELAINHGSAQPVRMKAIADAHGIPLRFLVQILLQLKGAGLVASTRGPSGGYYLLRPPDQISLADIVNVIDRITSNRADANGSYLSAGVKALRSVWQEIQVKEQEMLAEISLADLIRRCEPTDELSYQI